MFIEPVCVALFRLHEVERISSAFGRGARIQVDMLVQKSLKRRERICIAHHAANHTCG
jgi:hypothetical protein